MKKEYHSPVAALHLFQPCDLLSTSGGGYFPGLPGGSTVPNAPTGPDPALPDLDWD